MISRALGLLALAASVGLVTPEASPEPARDRAPAAASVDHDQRLHEALEHAVRLHVPGMSQGQWTLQRVERSTSGADGPVHVFATGRLGSSGSHDTRLQLTGRYDPVSGTLSRLSYKLRPVAPETAAAGPDWRVQDAVQHAFAQVLPDERIQFALTSAESARVEGGGRRFEGSGIGSRGQGEAQFVRFVLTLSARGELVEFDYHMQDDDARDPGRVALR